MVSCPAPSSVLYTDIWYLSQNRLRCLPHFFFCSISNGSMHSGCDAVAFPQGDGCWGVYKATGWHLHKKRWMLSDQGRKRGGEGTARSGYHIATSSSALPDNHFATWGTGAGHRNTKKKKKKKKQLQMQSAQELGWWHMSGESTLQGGSFRFKSRFRFVFLFLSSQTESVILTYDAFLPSSLPASTEWLFIKGQDVQRDSQPCTTQSWGIHKFYSFRNEYIKYYGGANWMTARTGQNNSLVLSLSWQIDLIRTAGFKNGDIFWQSSLTSLIIFLSHINVKITHFVMYAVDFSKQNILPFPHAMSWRFDHIRMDLVFRSLRIFQIDLWNPLAFLWGGHIIIFPVLFIYWTITTCSVICNHLLKDLSVEYSTHLSSKMRYK